MTPQPAQPDRPGSCVACGREFDAAPFDPAEIPATLNPTPDEPKNFVERSLKEHNRLLDTLSRQLAELLTLHRDLAPAGPVDNRRTLELLETLQQSLQPRHGLCINANCAPCRVHEEAIKEHVLLYIDWKVPGTVQKLQQTRHRN